MYLSLIASKIFCLILSFALITRGIMLLKCFVEKDFGRDFQTYTIDVAILAGIFIAIYF